MGDGDQEASGLAGGGFDLRELKNVLDDDDEVQIVAVVNKSQAPKRPVFQSGYVKVKHLKV